MCVFWCQILGRVNGWLYFKQLDSSCRQFTMRAHIKEAVVIDKTAV